MVGREDQEHVVRRRVAQAVLALLPDERPFEELREVRPDEGRPGGDAPRDVGPVGSVHAVGGDQRPGADSGDERCRVRAGMAAEDEVDRVQHVGRGEYVRRPGVEEVLLDAESLDVPSGAPDVRAVGDAVGRLLLQGVDPLAAGAERAPHLRGEGRVVEERNGARAEPADVVDPRRDLVAQAQDGVGVFLLAGGLVELDRRLEPEDRRVRRSRALPELPGYAQAILGKRVVEALERPRRGGQRPGDVQLV